MFRTTSRRRDRIRVASLRAGLLLASVAIAARAFADPVGTISTIAGTGTAGGSGDGELTATAAQLNTPVGTAVDAAGNVYIADQNNHRIRKIAAGTGIITTVAGTGVVGFLGEGAPAVNARLDSPAGVAVDTVGNLYIADYNNNRIRKVTVATGIITTVAGSAAQGFGGDGGQATAAQLNRPWGVAVDSVGNLYIGDRFNHRVRKVTAATGIITTIAGDGTAGYLGDGASATLARLYEPLGVAVDATGNVYVADFNNHRVRKVTASTGVITTLAGTGQAGYLGEFVDATVARLHYPVGVAVDAAGNVHIAGYFDQRIRKIDATTGKIATVAGSTNGFGGDGGRATAAQLDYPQGVSVDAAGNLYIADSASHRVRKVSPAPLRQAQRISTSAGTGTAGFDGDGAPGPLARLQFPIGIALDAQGNAYVADQYNHRVRKIDTHTGTITTFAGTGVGGFLGESVPATQARLQYPTGVAVDGAGNVYIADQYNHRVRKVTAGTGLITTVAGSGSAGFSGDGAAATTAQLNYPQGVAVDDAGNLYIADIFNHRIRKVTASTGVMTTLAGNGTQSYGGDNAPATAAQLNDPTDVAVDAAGNVYIADRSNHRVRKVALTGLITTVAGTGTAGFLGENIAGTTARLYNPNGLDIDAAGNVYIADHFNHRIRKLTVSTGILTTVAGNGTGGFEGDGGAATAASLERPADVAVDSAGNLFIGDAYNHRVRKVILVDDPKDACNPYQEDDFDGDCRADVVVNRSSTGQWFVLTSGSNFATSRTYTFGTRTDVPVAGDYDRDGHLDLAVFRPSTGTWRIRTSTSGFTNTLTYAFGATGDVPVPGDYDGDRYTDIAVWRPANGTWYILTSSSGFSSSVGYTWGIGTDRPVPGDYDGDGRTDVAVYRPAAGAWYILTSSSDYTSSTESSLGVRTDIPVPGDYDGDGTTDVAVYRPSTGTWYITTPSGGNSTHAWGQPLDRPVPADYDGDDRTDIAVFRPSTGTWHVLTSSSNFVASAQYQWGVSTDVALGSVAPYRDPTQRGDLDGDRVTDLGVYRPSTGTWYTLLSRNGFTTSNAYVWGASDDLPVRGDYDGDALPDVAVYRPSTGVWYIRTSTSGYESYEAYQWGGAGDVPVPADYDGDGATDVAVYRPGNGTWYVLTSSSAFTLYAAYQWGSPGDLPVPRDYDGDGTADVTAYRPSTGTWYVLTSGSGFTTYVSYVVGAAGDVPVPGDYDGDGLTDVAVYRPSTGAWMVRTSGSNYALSTYTWGASTDTVVPGDYDGDGRTDVAVFRPSDGAWYALLSSTNFTAFTTYTWGEPTDVITITLLPVIVIPPVSHLVPWGGTTTLTVVAAGVAPVYQWYQGTTGDASAPIAGATAASYTTPALTAPLRVWVRVSNAFSEASSATTTVSVGVAGSGTMRKTDFNGDGEADIAVWRPSTGVWWMLLSNGLVRSRQWGAVGDVPVAGDYDGDNTTDTAVWRPSTGMWWVIKSSDGLIQGQQWGGDKDIPVTGDYDGDHKTDIAIWRPSTGVWWVIKSSDGQVLSRQWGADGDIPVTGDYDGDGRTDMAVWRPSTGVWWVITSSDNQVMSQQWGAAQAPYNDVPVPGDYDGDQKTDIAIWRASTGDWWVIRSSNGTILNRQWGQAGLGDRPVSGTDDQDGDGKTDFTVWRAPSGFWYSLDSGTNYATYWPQQWGAATDVPVVD